MAKCTNNALGNFFFAIFSLSLLAVYETLLGDPDTGWHIMAGQWVLEHGKIPSDDPFAFSNSGTQWFNISWLWDVIIGGLHKISGLYYPIAFTILSVAAATWIICKNCQNQNLGVIPIGLAVMFAGVVYFLTASVRPHYASYIFILLFYWFASDKSKNLAWLPLMMIAWVNLHGGFLAGFIILGAFGLEALFGKDFSRFKKLFITGAVCLLATLVNPLGYEVYLGALRTLGGESQKFITEWKSPDEAWHFIYLGLVFAISLPALLKRSSLAERLLFVAWFVAAFSAMRNFPVMAIIISPVLAKGFDMLIAKSEKLSAKNADMTNDFNSLTAIKISRFVAVAVFLVMLIPFNSNIQFPEETTPYAEINYILANHSEARVLNHYDFGGKIIYLTKGKLKTFIDGRAETAFPDDVMADYITFFTLAKGWKDVPEQYDIDVLLLPKDTKYSTELEGSKVWKLVFEGEVAEVYSRK